MAEFEPWEVRASATIAASSAIPARATCRCSEAALLARFELGIGPERLPDEWVEIGGQLARRAGELAQV
jgi:hypothetical protein